MTVENVLERTVVRAAAPGGGAEAAGVETGSLLVALDGQSTKVQHAYACMGDSSTPALYGRRKRGGNCCGNHSRSSRVV